ncbi:MAG: ABC transporter substrate-binding protein [Rhodocyclaceae bacterium]|jgi:NitT/TauT family transport system substrate-binding protein|nr:ABC transporter substrate-binding protein [Rhodocyclaceae bacterium]
MDRRGFVRASPALGLAWLLAGCSSGKQIGLGIHPWIGYETLYLARDFGWLPSSVTLIEGATALDSLGALRAGRAAAACLTLDEVLRARAEGVPLQIALVFNISAGADVLLARPEINALSDLEGKRIGVEHGAVGDLVLFKALKAARLDQASVQRLDLQIDQQISAWQRNEIDAVVTYEPTASRIMRLGAQPLFDSRAMPDTIFDALAVLPDRARGAKSDLRNLIDAHFKGLEHLRLYRQDAIHRIAGRQNMGVDEVTRALAGVALPTLAANRSLLSSSNPRLTKSAARVGRWMADAKLVDHLPDSPALFSTEWLPRHA